MTSCDYNCDSSFTLNYSTVEKVLANIDLDDDNVYFTIYPDRAEVDIKNIAVNGESLDRCEFINSFDSINNYVKSKISYGIVMKTKSTTFPSYTKYLFLTDSLFNLENNDYLIPYFNNLKDKFPKRRIITGYIILKFESSTDMQEQIIELEHYQPKSYTEKILYYKFPYVQPNIWGNVSDGTGT